MNAKVRDFTTDQEKRIRTEAVHRVARALDHIQKAQQHLVTATIALSAIDGGLQAWMAAGKATSCVEQLVERTQLLQQARSFTLDSTHGLEFLRILGVREALKEPDK